MSKEDFDINVLKKRYKAINYEITSFCDGVVSFTVNSKFSEVNLNNLLWGFKFNSITTIEVSRLDSLKLIVFYDDKDLLIADLYKIDRALDVVKNALHELKKLKDEVEPVMSGVSIEESDQEVQKAIDELNSINCFNTLNN